MPFNDPTDGIGGTYSHVDGVRSDVIPGKRAPATRRIQPGNSSGYLLHFLHIPTGETVSFKAFLTALDDGYESRWNKETVYGRMDPISTFEGTSRTIRIGWDVPSASEEEGILNLREAERFLSMLYPVYEERDVSNFLSDNPITAASSVNGRKAAVMVAPPLFKMKFANLIMDTSANAVASGVSTSGLVGTISGLSYRPDIEQGFFGPFFSQIQEGALIPQTISFDLEFTVHHTTGLGWRRNKNQSQGESPTEKRTNNFPYAGNKILKPNS